jgi:hypothetical protein
MNSSWHPDEAQLLAYMGGDVDAGLAKRIRIHMGECEACREEIARIRLTFEAYLESTREMLPRPPEPWPGLRARLNELDAGRVQSRWRLFPRVSLRWAAAAAVLVIGVFMAQMATQSTVSAAELLERAMVRETTVVRPKFVRVKTRKAVYVRPVGAADDAMASAFRLAKFDWANPLSARSFAQWRNAVGEKKDTVEKLEDGFRIVTAPARGEIAEASITLQGTDYRPVQETFRFRNDEFVEITEAAAPPAQMATAPDTPATTPRLATVADELRVLAALHAIGADLGEPVEVTRTPEKVVVEALIVNPERERQIRSALDGLNVELRMTQPESVRTPSLRGAPERADVANPVRERLGASATELVFEEGDALLARAHALRALARRFPPEVEAQLGAAGVEMLRSIRRDHARQMEASAARVAAAIGGPGASVPVAGVWQQAAEAAFAAAQEFDRAATQALTSRPENPDSSIAELGRMASMLQARAAGLQ